MTFGWGFLIGILSTISVEAVGVIVAAFIVNARQRRAAKMVHTQNVTPVVRAVPLMGQQNWEGEH